MRLYALVFTCLVLRAHAASLPDKADIEKKLANVVKEVLDKDQPQTDNASSEQELIDQANDVKDVENNLRKVAEIPVKVIVENVNPELKTVADKKEDNEVPSEESAEIKRPEVDLKNPGPPQRMQHDNQNPENFKDSQQTEAFNSQTLNSWWKNSPEYSAIQQDLLKLKDDFNNNIVELIKSVQNVYNPKSQVPESDKKEENINLRASIKQDQSGTPVSSPGGFQNMFSQWAQQWQESFSNFNKTMTEYFQNQTSQLNSTGNTNGGNNWFNFPSGGLNFVNPGNQAEGAQSDEQKPPQNNNWFSAGWQNVQNLFSGNQQSQTPEGAQADAPQPAAPPPNRPVLNAIQNAISFFQPNNNNKPVQVPEPPSPEPSKPAEGSNSVPEESKPEPEKEKEKEKEKPQTPQPVTQSGPIKQLIGNNPIVQGIAGTVQRITQGMNPVKPRDEVKDAGIHDTAVKGGFYTPPSRPATGDNLDIGSSGVAVKNEPVKEAQEIPEKEPVKEIAPVPAVVPEKTE